VEMVHVYPQILVYVQIMVEMNANSQNALESLEMNLMYAMHMEHVHLQILVYAFLLIVEIRVKNQSALVLIQVKQI
jgi:hypothetical protein